MAEKNTLARPYAKAIFDMAEQDSDHEKWTERLDLISQISSDELVSEFVHNPAVDVKEIIDLFSSVGKKANNEDLDEKTINFLKLVVENKRINLICEVKSIFDELVKAGQGLIEAEVVSAYAINPSQKKQIKEALTKRFNHEVSITTLIDKSLVAGVIIRVGDLVIDGSVTTQLEKITKTLTI